MAFTPRDMSGSLFKNKKQTSPSQPGYRGDCMVDGKLYSISAWVKDTKAGEKFFSLAFSEPRQQDQQQQPGDVPDFR